MAILMGYAVRCLGVRSASRESSWPSLPPCASNSEENQDLELVSVTGVLAWVPKRKL